MAEHDPTCLVAQLEWGFVCIQAVLISDVGHSCGHVWFGDKGSFMLEVLVVAGEWGHKIRPFAYRWKQIQFPGHVAT